MRRPLVAGNWKMNLTLAQARSLVQDTLAGLKDTPDAGQRVEVAVCPSHVYLHPLGELLRGGPVALGAQDVYFEKSGAFTGEVSPAMIAETGAKFVILGHSERRHTIGHLEDDQMINRKLRAVQAAGMTPILCVGETLAERKSGQMLDVLSFQTLAGVLGVTLKSADDLVIAYEPVWAIGTGETASPEQAQEAHAHIRSDLKTRFGGLADGIRILYGGSVKPDNAEGIMRQPDVDGGLIGGASLKADAFLGIVRATLAALA